MNYNTEQIRLHNQNAGVNAQTRLGYQLEQVYWHNLKCNYIPETDCKIREWFSIYLVLGCMAVAN